VDVLARERAVIRLVARAGAVFGLGLALVVPFAGVAHAAEVGGLGVRPAHFDPNDPATKAYFKRETAPGSSFTDAVVVSNSSDRPLTVYVSAVDGLTSTTSGAVYANRTDPVRETATWVSPSRPTVTIDPHSEIEVPFTVTVPSSAIAGDHLAGLAFEDTTPRTSGGNFSVTEVLRAVVGIQIRLPGAAAFTAAPGTPRLVEMAGTENAAVIVPIRNTSGLLGKPKVAVTLSGNGYRRQVSRDLDTILPGDHIDYPFVWPDDLAPGTYEITVSLDAGGVASASAGRSTVNETLDGAANPGASHDVTIVTRTAASGLPMVLIAGLAALALAGGVVGGRALRSLRSRAV
jgi:hypothetical protein